MRDAIAILRCPVTHGSLTPLTPEQIATANERQTRGELLHHDGTPVPAALESGLVSEDGRYAYAVNPDGVAMLLASFAIELAPEGSGGAEGGLRGEKGSVQAFYDEFGWSRNDEGELVDSALFIDRRPNVSAYNSVCRQRVQAHLTGGRFLLDVASGPVQFPEYQAYGAAFDTRICVDLSRAALSAAQRNVGESGLYVLGDITNLPFADDALDGVVSLHTIYHVPADEQPTAFHEVFRVLKPGHTAVVAYSWQTIPWRERSLPMRVLLLPVRLVTRAKKLAGTLRRGSADAPSDVDLYYHAYDRAWFERQPWPFEPEYYVWSMLSPNFLRRYVRPGFTGDQLLRIVRRFEDRFPRFAGRVGRYPLIVIRKP